MSLVNSFETRGCFLVAVGLISPSLSSSRGFFVTEDFVSTFLASSNTFLGGARVVTDLILVVGAPSFFAADGFS
jgi:hypothetical protein